MKIEVDPIMITAVEVLKQNYEEGSFDVNKNGDLRCVLCAASSEVRVMDLRTLPLDEVDHMCTYCPHVFIDDPDAKAMSSCIHRPDYQQDFPNISYHYLQRALLAKRHGDEWTYEFKRNAAEFEFDKLRQWCLDRCDRWLSVMVPKKEDNGIT